MIGSASHRIPYLLHFQGSSWLTCKWKLSFLLRPVLAHGVSLLLPLSHPPLWDRKKQLGMLLMAWRAVSIKNKTMTRNRNTMKHMFYHIVRSFFRSTDQNQDASAFDLRRKSSNRSCAVEIPSGAVGEMHVKVLGWFRYGRSAWMALRSIHANSDYAALLQVLLEGFLVFQPLKFILVSLQGFFKSLARCLGTVNIQE